MWILARAAVYATFFVGLLLVFLPGRLLSYAGITSPHTSGIQQIFGFVLALAGALLCISCILSFVFIGRGTPAPFDALRRLVIRGPYRIVRNPMYLGAIAVLAGTALYYGSAAVSVYTIAFWTAMHCRVVFSEEPILAQSFGREYKDYRSRVGRWLPRL
jgi:protein-S-isoprenylcysteine O-methyltransferase Ste14